MKRSLLIPTLLALAVMCTGVAGLWVGGFFISGSIVADTGAAPADVECTQNMDLNGSNSTVTCEYDNPDGTVSIEFACDTSNITSTDARCNYEDGKDVKVWLSTDNVDFDPCESTPEYEYPAGLNTLYIRFAPHPERCPLSGTYSVTGTIV